MNHRTGGATDDDGGPSRILASLADLTSRTVLIKVTEGLFVPSTGSTTSSAARESNAACLTCGAVLRTIAELRCVQRRTHRSRLAALSPETRATDIAFKRALATAAEDIPLEVAVFSRRFFATYRGFLATYRRLLTTYRRLLREIAANDSLHRWIAIEAADPAN